jgi:hypothetical protein
MVILYYTILINLLTMRISDIQEHNITNEELEILEAWFDGLSDFCEMADGSWGIEWDGCYGRHWDRYNTKRAASVALDMHSDRMLAALGEARTELVRQKAEAHKLALEKGRKKRALKEAKTLGGQHPELQALLVKMRNEHKAA